MTTSIKTRFNQEAANDSKITISYSEIEARILKREGKESMPIVPAGTYKNGGTLNQCQFHRGLKDEINNGLIKHEDVPVVMRGAWFIFILNIKNINDREFHVIRRFMSRYRINILCRNDADAFMELWRNLVNSNIGKRGVYIGSSNPVVEHDLYRSNGIGSNSRSILLGGEYHWVNTDQIRSIKSIGRHIKKLEKLFGKTGDRKWQRLIQQAI